MLYLAFKPHDPTSCVRSARSLGRKFLSSLTFVTYESIKFPAIMVNGERGRLSKAHLHLDQHPYGYHVSNRSLASFSTISRQPSPPVAPAPQGLNHTHFRYELLDISKREIRLLKLNLGGGRDQPIVCSLFIVSLDQAPSFEALSYTWGENSMADSSSSTTLRRCTIYVDGSPVGVKKNLYWALFRLRNPTRRNRHPQRFFGWIPCALIKAMWKN